MRESITMNRRNLLKGIVALAGATTIEEPLRRFWPGWTSSNSGVIVPEAVEITDRAWEPLIQQLDDYHKSVEAFARRVLFVETALDVHMISRSQAHRMVFGDSIQKAHEDLIEALRSDTAEAIAQRVRASDRILRLSELVAR